MSIARTPSSRSGDRWAGALHLDIPGHGHLGSSNEAGQGGALSLKRQTPILAAVKVSAPLLLMDVDGVLNPYPDCPTGYQEYAIFTEDDEPVRLCARHGGWLRELAEQFTLVWATSWGDLANLHLCSHFGLPDFPAIAFPPAPFEARLKVPAIDSFVGDDPVALVDDVVTREARRWAQQRTSASLLIEVDHELGLTRDAVDELLAWRLMLG